MNKLFERIGITPGPWEVVKGYYGYQLINGKYKDIFVDEDKDALLISQAPAMLEALIRLELQLEKLTGENDGAVTDVIESSCGLPWPEIKSILEE